MKSNVANLPEIAKARQHAAYAMRFVRLYFRLPPSLIAWNQEVMSLAALHRVALLEIVESLISRDLLKESATIRSMHARCVQCEQRAIKRRKAWLDGPHFVDAQPSRKEG